MQYLSLFLINLLTGCNKQTSKAPRLNYFSRFSRINSLNSYRVRSSQEGRTLFSFSALLSLVIILSILAFTPGETLLPNVIYRGLIFDSLHYPAVFILYFVLRPFLSKIKSILLILSAIISVEVIQLFTGRESSISDILVGSAGLLTAIVLDSSFNWKKTIAVLLIACCWAIPFGHLFYLKNHIINSFPNIDQFETASARHAWEQVFNGKIASSKVKFVEPENKNEKAFMQVTKDQIAYWGVHINILKKAQKIPDNIYICASSNVADTLQIRVDDSRAPTYFERINIELPVTPEKKCQTYHIADYIEKLKKNNYTFAQSKITRLGLFMAPDSKADNFSIYDARFID